jgi:hypothetical protein
LILLTVSGTLAMVKPMLLPSTVNSWQFSSVLLVAVRFSWTTAMRPTLFAPHAI